MNQQVPVSKLSRSRIAGTAAVKLGVGHLGYKVKRPFMSRQRQQESKQALEDKNAQMLFDALVHLRGTALKIAQILTMEVELLPESYRKELEKSFHQVPPLNRVLVRKVLQEEFGKSPEALFAEFDDQAFAAASLGQVHKATLFDGTKVAVKIQYPGINVAMDSDMTLMRNIARGLPNAAIILQSLEEIKARLLEEVDYRIEADNTRWFQKHLAKTDVSVPSLFDDRCGQRVLTSEYIEGQHIEEWLQTNPSQKMRNTVAQAIYDLFVYSARSLRCLHADPNPGNYLFHEDGTISLIDFGCVKHLSQDFTDILPRLLQAYYDKKPSELKRAYSDLNMNYHRDFDELYEDILSDFGEWVTRVFREESFDFAKNYDYSSSGQEIIRRVAQLSGVDNLADEFIFFNRTVYGLCKIFERMGATVRMQHHWIK